MLKALGRSAVWRDSDLFGCGHQEDVSAMSSKGKNFVPLEFGVKSGQDRPRV